MKKSFTLVLFCFFAFALTSSVGAYASDKESPAFQNQESARNSFGGGSGTEADPYLIATPDHLDNIRQFLGDDNEDLYFLQTSDIDLGQSPWNDGAGWVPLGDADSPFTAQYDGDGHVVIGLTIDREATETPNQGLFGYTDGAEIKNLGVVNGDVKGGLHTALLVGQVHDTTVENCFSTGSVFGTLNSAAGLVGGTFDHSTINNSYSSADVVAEGGLNNNFIGGLVGLHHTSTINNSYSDGTVDANIRVGGLVGWNFSNSTIYHSYSTAYVTGAGQLGGLVGNNGGVIVNSYWNEDTSGDGGQSAGTGQHGEARNTEDMTYPYSGDTFVDWDFSVLWTEDDRYLIKEGYPFLRWEVANIAVIYAEPDEFSFMLFAEETDSEELTIGNIGGTDLVYDILIEETTETADASESWLSVDPTSGVVPGESEAIVSVMVSSEGLTSGVYTANLIIEHEYGEDEIIEVTLQVVETEISIDPTSFDFTIFPGDFESDVLSIENIGDVDFTFSLVVEDEFGDEVEDPFWLSVDPVGGVIPAGDDLDIDVNVDGEGLAPGEYMAEIVLVNGGQSERIPVSLNVEVPPLASPENLHVDELTGLFTWDAPTMARLELEAYDVYLDGEFVGSTEEESWTYQYLVYEQEYEAGVVAVYNWGESDEMATIDFTYLNADQFAGGSGTEEAPWLIETAENLDNVRSYLGNDHGDKHFLQIADIDLGVAPWDEGEGWLPIGDEDNAFYGSYDGGGYEVTGMTINRPESDKQGLFGFLRNAHVTDLGVTDADVLGQTFIGALSGHIFQSNVSLSYSTGTIEGTGNAIGGLVGRNNQSVIEHSYSHASAEGNGSAGGLVGSSNSTIENSYSTGDVTGEDYVGGLVGISTAEATYIFNSYSSSNVTGNDYVGGLAGSFEYGTLEQSYSTGDVDGGDYVGGLAGVNFYAIIKNTYSRSSVSGTRVGGLVGMNFEGQVINSYSAGALNGSQVQGGLIMSSSFGVVYDSYWDVDLSGTTSSPGGGEGRTTEEMTYPYDENTYVDWDIYFIWKEDHDYVNDGYMILRDEEPEPYTITIHVVEDADGDPPIENATVELTAFEDKTTDETGMVEYTLPDGTYYGSVSALGYVGKQISFSVDGSDDTIMVRMTDLMVTPFGLEVDTETVSPGDALFSWYYPIDDFRYDDGIVDSQLGSAQGTSNTLLGAVHRYESVLQKMSWYLTDMGGPHNTVTVWVIGLTEEGAPDRDNIIYTSSNVPNIDNRWNTYEFGEPLELPDGFYLAVSYNGFLGLATDDGEGEPWEFIPETHYLVGDITDPSVPFVTLEDQGFEVNFLLRGHGVKISEIEYKDTRELASEPGDIDVELLPVETPIDAGSPRNSGTRTFEGFNVFLNNEMVAENISEINYLFEDLEGGEHLAGVQSVYTTGTSEIAEIGFSIAPETFTVTFEVADEDGNPIEDAIVTFDGETYVAGHYVIEDVEEGTYNYIVEKAGYFPVEGQVDVVEDKTVEVVMIIDETFANDVDVLEVLIYPNPAVTHFDISSSVNILEIELIDLLGQRVYHAPVNADNYRMNVSSLERGLYIVRVYSEEGTLIRRVQIMPDN